MKRRVEEHISSMYLLFAFSVHSSCERLFQTQKPQNDWLIDKWYKVVTREYYILFFDLCDGVLETVHDMGYTID